MSRVLFLGIAAISIATAQTSRPVDDAVLKDAGRNGDEWLSYNGNWSEQRYSPLNQINASNVSRLGLAWYLDIPMTPKHQQTRQEATPLVRDGVLYSIAPWSVVYAVDARTRQRTVAVGSRGESRGLAIADLLWRGESRHGVLSGQTDRAGDRRTFARAGHEDRTNRLGDARVAGEYAVHHHDGSARDSRRQGNRWRSGRRVCGARILRGV